MKHGLPGETALGKSNVDWIFGLSQNGYYVASRKPTFALTMTLIIPPSPFLLSRRANIKKGGSGYWKLSNSLLESEEFTTKMSFVIKHAAEKHKDIADKRLYWEMMKMEIRMFAIRFAKTKANADRNIKLDLYQKLEEINLRIDATPENSSLANEARLLKLELDEIAVRKTRGTTIRSRARWYELCEKCNKYFF